MIPWPSDQRKASLSGLQQASLPNPFSSHFVRPGSIPYRFSGGLDVGTVGTRLLEWSSRHFAASIIGPHGTGKSTLLHSLASYLADAGYDLIWFRLSQTDCRAACRQHILRSVAEMWDEDIPRPSRRCIIVDGYEQLDWLTRFWIAARLQWARVPNRFGGQGRPGNFLLVTAHATAVGIPSFFQTEWQDGLVEELTMEKLLQLSPDERALMVARAHARARLLNSVPERERNVRDYWFSLYDDYERLRRELRYKYGSSDLATAEAMFSQ